MKKIGIDINSVIRNIGKRVKTVLLEKYEIELSDDIYVDETNFIEVMNEHLKDVEDEYDFYESDTFTINSGAETYNNLIDVYINKLRVKLKEQGYQLYLFSEEGKVTQASTLFFLSKYKINTDGYVFGEISKTEEFDIFITSNKKYKNLYNTLYIDKKNHVLFRNIINDSYILLKEINKENTLFKKLKRKLKL